MDVERIGIDLGDDGWYVGVVEYVGGGYALMRRRDLFEVLDWCRTHSVRVAGRTLEMRPARVVAAELGISALREDQLDVITGRRFDNE